MMSTDRRVPWELSILRHFLSLRVGKTFAACPLCGRPLR